MNRKGGKLAFIALIVGIAIGCGILALQSWIADEIISALDEEAQKSVGGSFKADQISVSLLTLSALAVNPRIENQQGDPDLRFKKIKVHFSLHNILQKQIALDVRLVDGHSEGIDGDSTVFRFIDSLVAPLPPELDRPGRWKFKLSNLSVERATFAQRVGSARIEGTGLSLRMIQDEKTNFTIPVKVRGLTLRDKHNHTASLGNVVAKLYLDDDALNINSYKMFLGNSWLEAVAKVLLDSEALSGDLRAQLTSKDLSLPPGLDFVLSSTGTLAGTFSEPEIATRSTLAPESSARVELGGGITPIDFTTLQCALDIVRKNREFTGRAATVTADGPAVSLRASEPLSISDDAVGGALEVSAGEFMLPDATLRGVALTVRLSGSIESPSFGVEGTVAEVSFGEVAIPRVAARARITPTELEFSLRSLGEAARATGTIDLLTSSLREGELALDQFALAGAVVDGEIAIGGKLTAADLKGTGTLRIMPPPGSSVREQLDLDMKLEKGKILIDGTSTSRSIKMTGGLDLFRPENQKLSLVLTSFDVSQLEPTLDCITIDGSLEYTFGFSNPKNGSGQLLLNRLDVGCQPYTLRLVKGQKMPIAAGKLQIPPFAIAGSGSKITTQGSIGGSSGFNVSVSGGLDLQSLLGLVPAVDDMRGELTASVKVTGPIDAPILDGELAFKNGQLSIASADVSAVGVTGDVAIRKNIMTIRELQGQLNSGTFSVSGAVPNFRLSEARLDTTLRNIALEPSRNLNVLASADLGIHDNGSGRPIIEGDVSIDSAEFRESTNLLSVLRDVSSSVASVVVRPRTTETSAVRRELPKVDLKIGVHAPRNLFILTTWANAELALDMRVSGDLSSPQISGTVRTLSGSVGLKNRRFDIISGTATFRPGNPDPHLDLLAENYIPARTGETVLVILEASGPLYSPRITLSSDQALSERELLELITESGGRTTYSPETIGPEAQTDSLFSDLLSLDFGRFLKSLTRIDSVFLEPLFNPQTGIVDPAVVAERKLTERMRLQGESTLGGAAPISRARVIYDLTNRLSATGIIENDSANQRSPIETNLSYTALARQPRFVKIKMRGNDAISEFTLLDAVRINQSSRIPVGSEQRIASNLRDFYHARGFFDAAVTAECGSTNGFCRDLTITILEGAQSRIDELTLLGDELPPSLTKLIDSIRRDALGSAATDEYLKARAAEVVRELRSEGYIGARVDAAYTLSDKPDRRDLTLTSTLGRPVSFTFVGNKAFSPEEFLETINLFKRRQPFGPNTISILVENMERLYRQAGYLYAAISFTREDDASGRILYTITIVEEGKVAVSNVELSGNQQLSTKKIRSLLRRSDRALFYRIFTPEAVVEEEIAFHARSLQELFVAQGYPYATVRFELVPDPVKPLVTIVYHVEENTPSFISSLQVIGTPTAIDLPPLPDLPASIVTVDDYIRLLGERLRELGFRNAAIQSLVGEDEGSVIIELSPGSRTYIGALEIRGNDTVTSEVILKEISVREGDPWNEDEIGASRRRLLKLGLFARVEAGAADGSIDQERETLLFNLSQRPLDTLAVGGGVNSEFGLHLFGEASDRALFADGRSLSLRFDTYYDDVSGEISQGVASLRYTNPALFDGPFTHTEDLRFQKLNLNTQEFDLDRVSLTSNIYRTTDWGLTYAFGHTIQEENLTSVSPGAIIGPLDTGAVRLSYLNGSFDYDRRDNPLNPNEGLALGADYKLSSAGLYSQGDFLSVIAKASYIYPLPILMGRFSIATNVRLGISESWGDNEEIPITQRFYLGGRKSVRGFAENSLGPRADDGSIIGGDRLSQINFEYGYRAGENYSLHLFTDAGNVYLKSDDPNYGDLRYSGGGGIRLISPVGPIGLEIGHPLDRSFGGAAVRFHFSVGSSF